MNLARTTLICIQPNAQSCYIFMDVSKVKGWFFCLFSVLSNRGEMGWQKGAGADTDHLPNASETTIHTSLGRWDSATLQEFPY